MPTFKFVNRKYDGKYAELYHAVNALRDTPDKALIVSGIGDRDEIQRWQVALSGIRPGGTTMNSAAVAELVIHDFDIESTIVKNGRGDALKVWLTEKAS